MQQCLIAASATFQEHHFPFRCAGVVAALQANDLPNPVVQVGVENSQKYAVAAARALQVIAAHLAPLMYLADVAQPIAIPWLHVSVAAGSN